MAEGLSSDPSNLIFPAKAFQGRLETAGKRGFFPYTVFKGKRSEPEWMNQTL
jgi:hypothetical protein